MAFLMLSRWPSAAARALAIVASSKPLARIQGSQRVTTKVGVK